MKRSEYELLPRRAAVLPPTSHSLVCSQVHLCGLLKPPGSLSASAPAAAQLRSDMEGVECSVNMGHCHTSLSLPTSLSQHMNYSHTYVEDKHHCFLPGTAWIFEELWQLKEEFWILFFLVFAVFSNSFFFGTHSGNSTNVSFCQNCCRETENFAYKAILCFELLQVWIGCIV